MVSKFITTRSVEFEPRHPRCNDSMCAHQEFKGTILWFPILMMMRVGGRWGDTTLFGREKFLLFPIVPWLVLLDYGTIGKSKMWFVVCTINRVQNCYNKTLCSCWYIWQLCHWLGPLEYAKCDLGNDISLIWGLSGYDGKRKRALLWFDLSNSIHQVH